MIESYSNSENKSVCQNEFNKKIEDKYNLPLYSNDIGTYVYADGRILNCGQLNDSFNVVSCSLTDILGDDKVRRLINV